MVVITVVHSGDGEEATIVRMSALHQAVLVGNLEAMRVLIESGAKINITDAKGLTALHYAAWHGRGDMVRALLRSGASLEVAASHGDTPLHLAAQQGHADLVTLLLQNHADPAICNNDDRTVLDLAVEYGRIQAVQVLVSHSACAALIRNSSRLERTTPLHLAAKNGHVACINLLLSSGMDVSLATVSGTCLHEAVLAARADIVCYLVDCGIDLMKMNKEGLTAAELAGKFQGSRAHAEMRELLQEAERAIPCRAVAAHFTHDPAGLQFKEGESVTQVEQRSDGVSRGFLTKHGFASRRGHFPSECVRSMDSWLTSDEGYQSQSPSTDSQNYYQPLTATPVRLNQTEDPFTSSWQRLSYMSLNEADTRGRLQQYQQVQPGQHFIFSPTPPPRVQSIQPVSNRLSCESGISLRQSQSGSSSGSLDCYPAGENSLDLMSLYQAGYKHHEVLLTWLQTIGFASLFDNFLSNGYDLPTISRATPEDLTAVGVASPADRKRLKVEISKLRLPDTLPNYVPATVCDWLEALSLGCYSDLFASQGYNSLAEVSKLTWEDMEEMGVSKLGHQKKLSLGVERLKKLLSRRSSSGQQQPVSPAPHSRLMSPAYVPVPAPLSATPFSQLSGAPLYHSMNQRYSGTSSTSAGSSTPSSTRQQFSSYNGAGPSGLHGEETRHPVVVMANGTFVNSASSECEYSHLPDYSNFNAATLRRAPPPPPPKRNISVSGSATLGRQPESRRATTDIMAAFATRSQSADGSYTAATIGSFTRNRSGSFENLPQVPEQLTPSVSTTSLESQQMPFANENCGTIKQKQTQERPSAASVFSTQYVSKEKDDNDNNNNNTKSDASPDTAYVDYASFANSGTRIV